MTVYVTQELKGRDLSSALEFGELQVVVPADIQITPDTIEEVYGLITGALSNFDPLKDYLLLSGDPVVMCLAYQVADEEAFIQHNIARVSVLRWDRIDSRYIVFDI
jgi:hypothetical protein